MPYQIYFGEIEIKNTLTGEIKTIGEIIYNDSTKTDSLQLRKEISKRLKYTGNVNIWKVNRFLKDSAKKVGKTNY